MLLRNESPFAAIGFNDLHRDGTIMAVICVRGSYDLMRDGNLHVAAEQQSYLNDFYEGDPHRTPLLHVSDLMPYKPHADITLLGSAYAPDGVASETWQVRLAVGSHSVSLRVHGPRRWEPTLKKLRPTWKLGPSESVTSVPLDYRLAAGGRIVGDPEGGADLRNPIGPGILHSAWSRVGIPLRAPQIDSLGAPIDSPFVTPLPQGFAPIPPFWLQRERHLGTRDEKWQRDICPRMPSDFSYQFFQTAHRNLILPHLLGQEIVRFEGLTSDGGNVTFSLPGVVPIAHHAWYDGRELTARLTLDGLHLDLRAEEEPWRVDLTWRGWLVQCPSYRGATLAVTNINNAQRLIACGEDGLVDEEISR